MSLYSDSPYPVGGDLATIHARQLDRLAEPGNWGTGARRPAIAANFSRNDRIAIGYGIPVEATMHKETPDIRARLRLNDYRSAAKTFRHVPEERTSRVD